MIMCMIISIFGIYLTGENEELKMGNTKSRLMGGYVANRQTG